MSAPKVPISINAKTGVWHSDGLPMLYLPRHFFNNLHLDIEKMVGYANYRQNLYQSGYQSAYFWCQKTAKEHVLDALACYQFYLQRLSERGWGLFSFKAQNLHQGTASITVAHSSFVLHKQLFHLSSEQPACYMFEGWFSGAADWFSDTLNLGHRHHCFERQCAGISGGESCLFSVVLKDKKMSNYRHLFKPIQLNKLTIKNRILSTAHAEVVAEGGFPTGRFLAYYEEKAKGGLGLAICGGSSPVSIDSPPNWWKSIDLTTDEVIPHLQNLADVMHRHDAKIMIQATHMGRRSTYAGYDWPHLLSPSGIRDLCIVARLKRLNYTKIERIVKDYAQAALRVKQGGLDGIEISAAHQHLIDQFWSPRTNKRSDQYGGSLENRMRFGLEVLTAIRQAVGDDFCLGLRMSGDEFHPDGLSHDDLKEIAVILAETGLLDFISVIGSGADTHDTLANCMPPMELPPAPFVQLAFGIKSVVNLPVMHAQSIKDAMQAEQILAQGYCDMVGMTRAHIADPHLVNKILEGRETQIRQCVGANYCINRQYLGRDVLCVQNAATNREQFMPHNVRKNTSIKRKIVVVGGGPAGLEAARVSAERGHNVVLFERQQKLGGQILLAAKAPKRDQMAGIVRWFDMELKRLAVDVRLQTTADVAMIVAEKPDIIIIATGGHNNLSENAKWRAEEGFAIDAWRVLNGEVELKKNVLVFDGISSTAGVGVADYIAQRGALVELATPEPMIADDSGGTSFPIFYRSLCQHNVIFSPNFMLEEIYQEGEHMIAVLKNEYSQQIEEREVEQIVIENSIKPNDELYFALQDGASNKGMVNLEQLFRHQAQTELLTKQSSYLLYRIGEAVSARNIHGCIYDALRLAKDF